MTALLLVFTLSSVSPSWAQDKKPLAERVRPNVDLIGAERPYWLKIYYPIPHSEEWTLNLKVRNLKKGLPRILKIFENSGVTLTVPLQNSAAGAKSQQLTYKLSDKAGRESLRGLGKIASFEAPRVRLAAESTPLAEIKAKIDKLLPERAAHAKELAGMPAISGLADEMLEHLLLVEAMAKKKEIQVLLNITVEEKE